MLEIVLVCMFTEEPRLPLENPLSAEGGWLPTVLKKASENDVLLVETRFVDRLLEEKWPLDINSLVGSPFVAALRLRALKGDPLVTNSPVIGQLDSEPEFARSLIMVLVVAD